jgi:hypothetical protein
MGSRLFYHGTEIEIELGDRVEMSRWIRKPVRGVVCYIPGISSPHSDLEYEGIRQWAIRAEDGAIYPILYEPLRFKPPAKIKFLGRGNEGILPATEKLE